MVAAERPHDGDGHGHRCRPEAEPGGELTQRAGPGELVDGPTGDDPDEQRVEGEGEEPLDEQPGRHPGPGIGAGPPGRAGGAAAVDGCGDGCRDEPGAEARGGEEAGEPEDDLEHRPGLAPAEVGDEGVREVGRDGGRGARGPRGHGATYGAGGSGSLRT